MKSWVKWDETSIDIVRELYGKIPVKEIRRLHLPEFTEAAIRCCAKRISVTNESNRIKYSHDENFFSTRTPISDYWAGFIAADGCVYSGESTIGIHLCIDDREHLVRFANDTEFTGVVDDRPKENSSRVRIHSAKKWIRDLRSNYNITERKSLNLTFPCLDNPFPFILGYIDGDGYIGIDNGYLCFSMVGTCAFLSSVKDVFDAQFPGTKRLAIVGKADANLFRYGIKGVRALKILSYLLSLPVPKLGRKWSKVIAYSK